MVTKPSRCEAFPIQFNPQTSIKTGYRQLEEIKTRYIRGLCYDINNDEEEATTSFNEKA